jgi:autotransporter-associated beta strand protein
MSLTNTAGAYAGSITVTNGTLQANTTLRGANISVGNSSTASGSVLMGSGQVGTVTINTNGQISPGNSVGTLSVSNSLTFNGGGSYLWEINSTNGPAGTTWDLITVDNAAAGDGLGSLTIGGAFTIAGSAIDGFTFDGAQNYAGFQIVKASSLTGSLGNLSLSGLGTGSWSFSFTNNVGLFASYTAAGSTITFTNSTSANQGAANIAGGNALGAYATITNVGGATIVVISNTAPLTFTNEANSYTGATIIEQGTAVTTVNSLNAANGAFGNASTDIQVGSTNSGNTNAAALLIGASGATVGRVITINSGGTGLRTVGATNGSGTATYSGNIAMATNVTLSASNSGGTTLFSGGLSGAGNVTAAGSGTVVFSGNNTYTGTTTVTNGTTLLIANNSALGDTGSATTVVSGGTLALSNAITVAEGLTITGTGVGGAGALQNVSGNNTVSGAITLGSGGATIANPTASTTFTISGGITGAGQPLTIDVVSGATNIINTTGINTTNGGSLIKTNSGVLIISAAGNYTGGTTLGGGTVRVGDNSALGTGVVTLTTNTTLASSTNVARTLANNFAISGGTLTLGSSTQTGAMTLSGTLSLGSATRTITVASVSSPATIAGVISGDATVGMTKNGNGTLTLTAANTYDGTTTISAGTLSIGSGGGTGSVAGAIANNSALIVNRTGDLTLGGIISGSGTFDKLGAGTLLLSGNNTFTSALAISNGAVRISNANGLGATNGATVVSSGAALELTGGITTAQEGLTLNGAGISSGGALRNISGNNTYAGGITLGSASVIASDAGLLTISGGINGANFALTNTGSGNVAVSGAITNSSGRLVKEGLGTLTLTGANTYSGGTLVSAGTLVGNTTGLQGAITNSSLVIFDQSTNGTYSSVVSGTGALIKTNTGVLTLTGDNTYTGGTMIGQGAISVGNGGATGSLAGTITNNGGLVFNRTGSLSMTGAISGSGVLTNLGAGTVTLSGANTYSGGTLISAGALQGNTTSLQGTITNNGSVIFDQSTDGTYSSVLSGTGTLIKTNAGVLTLSGANAQGGTLIGGGTLSIGSGGTTGSLTGPITNNATLLFNRSDNLTQASVISGSGALNKAGAGTLTLSQANTYTSATTISNGAISISDASALGTAAAGTTVVSGAALELSGGITVASESLALNGTGISTGGALRNISGNNAYNGAISLGSASRINSDAGTLSLGGGITGTGFGLTIGGTGNTTIGTTGINTGAAGTLTKDGGGTLTITASGDYTGATTVSAGVLNIQNATATGTTAGGISVTSGAALQIQGGISVGAEALTLNGAGVSTDGALRNISGNNVYGGAITLGSASRINSDAGSLTLNGGITGTGHALTIGGAGNTTIGTTGINTGAAGTLTKDGLGTLTVTAAGDYTGATTVSAGVLNIQNATATGTTAGGISVTSGAALELQGGITVGAESLALNGTGISSGGALRNISGNNTYGGTITLGSASRINSDAGTLTLAGITGTQNLTIGGAANTVLAGAISTSTGTLTKDGAGTATLSSGANTFTGNVNISAGTLAVTNGGAIANSAVVTVDSGATFSVLGGETVGRFTGAGTVDIATSQTLTTSFDSASNNFAGSLTGAGGLTKTGSGTLTLSGNNSGYSGNTTLNNGTFLVGAGGAFGSGGTVTINFDTGTGTRELASADASSYTLNNNFNLFFNSFSLGSANTGSLTLGASTNTFFLGDDVSSTTRTITVTGNQIIGAAVTGGANNNLNKAGSGTLILAGDASGMGGAITNAAGRLQIGNGSTTGTLGNKNVTVASSAELAFNRSDNLTYGGVASGAGTLLKLGAGTVTFTGANTYTGATTISNGSLALSGSGALSSSTALNLAVSGANFSISGISGTNTEVASLTGVSGSTVSLGGKALTFGGNNANSTFAGEMSGTGGSFIKTGTGTVTLSGSNSMTGTSQLNNGTILVGNNAALGIGTMQFSFAGGTGTRALASADASSYTMANNFNLFFNSLSLGSAGTGSLTLGASTNTFFLGNDGGVNTRTITVNGSHAIAAQVTGDNRLAVSGGGTLTLSGANTFSGGSQLNDGTILVGNNSALGTGTMQFDFAGNAGTRTLAAVDSSAYTLNNNFNLFFNALTLGQSGGTTGTLTLGASTNTFNLGSDGTSTTRTITVNGTQIIGAAVTGGANNNLNKAGSGTLVLAGDASALGGTITNSAGRLQIGNGSTTGTIGNKNVNVASSAELAFNRSDNLSYGGVISGAGALLKFGAGTLTLSTANTFTGTLTIGAGGLSVSANNNLGGGTAMTISNAAKLLTTASFTSARSLTVGDGGAEINVASSTTFSNTGTVSGSTALTKSGGGTLSLSNASSSYDGTVAVTAGTLQVNGTAASMGVNITNANSVLMGAGSIGAVTVNNGTRIAPGNSVGNLSVSALTLEAGGGYNWEINAATGTEGTDWDLITVGGGTGTVAINSTSGSPFTIFLQGNPTGWNVTNSYSWTIIDAGTLTDFDSTKFTVNFTGFGGTTPTGNFSFSNVSGNLVMAYAAPDNTYNVTVGANTAANQGSAEATNSVAQFTGSSALNKFGAGTLVMTNSANDYSGVTTVKEGTIQIDVNAPNNAAGALGNASTAVVIGDTTNNVAAGFNIGVAGVTNSRGLSVVAGTGAADRIIGTTITSGVAEQAGTVAVNTNTTFNAASGGALLVSGAISGAGNITISNGGTNIFSGANTYSGTTTILTNATLTIANNNALGVTNGGTTVNNGGTLALSNNISTAENITIAGSGGTNADGALRNLSGANTNTGTITLSANATIAADSGTSLQLGNINNGAVGNQLTFSNATNSTILLTGNLTNMDTSSTFFKTGTGSLVISNSGATVGGAQLQLGGGTVTLAAGSYSTNTGTSPRGLDLGLDAATNNSSLDTAFYVNSGVTMSNTAFVAAGTGQRTMGTESTNGTATFSGEIYLGSTTLNLSAAGGGTAAFTGNLVNTGNITKVGAGTVTLSGNNTVVGSVDINAGTLTVSGSTAINDSSAVTIASNAVFNLSANETVGSIAGQGNITLGGQLIAGGNGTSTDFSGVMSGSGAFVKTGSGTLTLSGANNFTGQSFLVGGTTLFTAAPGGSFSNTINLAETNGTANVTMALGGSGLNLSNALVVRSGSSNNTVAIDARNASGTTTLSGDVTLNKNTTLLATNTGGLALTGSAMSFAANTTLTVTNAANVSIANALSTSGDALIDKRGSGTLTMSGSATSAGSLRFDLYGGELLAATTNSLGDKTGGFIGNKLYFDGGTLGVATNITLGGDNGVTLGAAGGTIRVASGATLTLQGFINDQSLTGLTLSKTGAGTLFFDKTGVNDFNGTTIVVNEGVLSAWNPNLLSSTVQLGATNGATSGTYRFNKADGGVTATNNFVMNAGGGTIEVTADTLTSTGVLSGAGAFTKAGSGTLILNSSNSMSGGSTLSAGVIRAANANALGTGSLAASAGTVLEVTNGINIANNLSVYTVRFLNGGNTLSGTITNANTIYDAASGTTNTVSGFMTGAGGVELIGGGVLNITGTTNNYTGNTTISNGTLRISTLANSNTTSPIGVNNNVTLAGTAASTNANSSTTAVMDYTGGNVTTDRAFVMDNGGGTINMATAATEMTLTGSASGTGKLIVGEGTLILNGSSNAFAPGSIQVDSGATLQLAANNQIGDSTGLILNGGTFRVGTASTGFSDTLGTLTLSASSTIDLGAWSTGLRTLTFANSSAITWSGTLTITNWQGVALQSSDVAEIIFGTGGLTSTQLGQVYWANQNINGGTLIGGGELVPIPEPRVYAAAVALLAAVGWRERKRLIGLLRRKR